MSHPNEIFIDILSETYEDQRKFREKSLKDMKKDSNSMKQNLDIMGFGRRKK